MARRFKRDENWRPECGYFLSKKQWDCPLCGWTLKDSQLDDFGFDPRDNFSSVKEFPRNIEDADRLNNRRQG
jgi:hypothetical protein